MLRITMAEPPDHHRYAGVLLYADTLRFFSAAAQFYETLLREDVAAVNGDSDLKLLLTSEETERFAIHDELARAERVRRRLQELATDDDQFGRPVALTHGDVRYLKSIGHLYMKQLLAKRASLASRPNISREALAAVDQKLRSLDEKLEMGVFKDATVRPLLVDEMVSGSPAESSAAARSDEIANVRAPRPVFIDSIEITDPELRARCLDLLGQFSETGQHDRLDTVVSEATRILEVRLRTMCGAGPTVVGAELASFALSGAAPRIALSVVPAEQEAAHLLFRGVFGFVRNRVHHHLVADLSPVRALQIVATMDYLLSLLGSVQVQSPLPGTPPAAD
jgi:hypothetical protein